MQEMLHLVSVCPPGSYPWGGLAPWPSRPFCRIENYYVGTLGFFKDVAKCQIMAIKPFKIGE